jgi:glyoxylase-like metal-dependent hydrolase (beta-lactamase superfamily II)
LSARFIVGRFRLLAICSAVVLISLSAGERVYTQANRPAQNQNRPAPTWPPKLEAPAAGEVEVLPVQGNVYMISGAGGNITVQATPDGVLLVDTGTAAMADKVLAAVRGISKGPLRYIINTSDRVDYTGGNEKLAPAGEIVPFREPDYTAGPQGAIDTHRASVVSSLTAFHRMAAETNGKSARPEGAWPDNTFSTPWKRLYFDDEPVVITRVPGTTDGNVVVLFRKSDVLSAGDLFDTTAYPMIDIKAGGSIQAEVDALNKLIEFAVPSNNAEGGTKVIPAHGRICDHADVVYYRDMITIVRDRIQDMIKRGLTLDQVKAARPTRDYDARYGKQTGPWTTDMFVEAAYRSLSSGSK